MYVTTKNVKPQCDAKYLINVHGLLYIKDRTKI